MRLPKKFLKCSTLQNLNLRSNKIIKLHIDLFQSLKNLNSLNLEENPILYPVESDYIDIFKLKKEMGDKLILDDILYEMIKKIYIKLTKKSNQFNFVNSRKCKSFILPLHIYSEQELLKKINDWKENFVKDKYKKNTEVVILYPNKFTYEVKSFDVTILVNYIYHLYNSNDIYLKWNVPKNLLEILKIYRSKKLQNFFVN